MICLALEFSSDRRSVALARGGAVLAEAVQHTESRATDAFGLIARILAEAKISRDEIEVIAVGLGPGSYTGIRAAIAVAQGWQLARGVKLLGISSVAAMAAQAQAENIFGRIRLAVDAQRGEFYLGSWEISADKIAEVCPLKIVPATAVAAADDKVIGPEMPEKIFPTASALARLAAGLNDFVAGEELMPIYLRETTFVKAVPARTI
jgi:tRNA threonylcarbamoyladenosine biosynthesis protein TsaB